MLSRLLDPVTAWWAGLSRPQRVHRGLLALLVVVAAVMQLVLYDWYIEDAAISFAYSRNLAWGEGLVAVAGAERVEGYSNPLWVFLLAPWYWFGVTAFVSSKVFAVLLSAGSVVLVWDITRQARGGREDAVALVAAALLAFNAQFAIWNASGLESPLVSFLMALGVWTTLREARTGSWPFSAMVWFALAITRPEGAMYAAIGGMWAGIFAWGERRWLWPLKWLLTFIAPFGVYHALRYAYFAYALPNTYYAKSSRRTARAFVWTAKCWEYLRDYATELWQAWLMPVYVVAVLGLRGWRGGVAAAAVLLLAVSFGLPFVFDLVDAPHFLPRWWVELRVYTLVGLGLLVSRLGTARPAGPDGAERTGWRAVVLSWDLAAAVVFFAWWASGDWMKGYRWMSFLAVPASVLLAVGLGELADGAVRWVRVRPRGWLLAALLAPSAVLLWPNLAHLAWFEHKPETSPQKVRKRVNYMDWVADRLHLDHVVNLDVDMGATVYWARPDYEIVDLAGLLDVPFSHHRFNPEFVREYVYGERQPEFIHSHGGWARASRLQTFDEWERYFEIPGYPSSKRSRHIGNYVRRDLFLRPWSGPGGREVLFQEGVRLHGWSVPAGQGAPGESLYMEVGLSAVPRTRREPFRVLAFLASAGGAVASWDLPPGYDWYEVHQWTADDVFWGRFSLPLPDDLPLGTYDLGFVVLGADGAPLVPMDRPVGAVLGGRGAPARFMRDEVRFPEVVEVVARRDLRERAKVEITRSREAAAAGACDEAEALWRDARRRVTRQERWILSRAPEVRSDLARCWVAHAATADDPVASFERARRWDHHLPELRRARRPLVRELLDRGHAAREAGDPEAAYRAFADVMRVDPSRSWARRWAEEARSERLGIGDPPRTHRSDTRHGPGVVPTEPRRHKLAAPYPGSSSPRRPDHPEGPDAPDGAPAQTLEETP